MAPPQEFTAVTDRQIQVLNITGRDQTTVARERCDFERGRVAVRCWLV